VSPVAARMDGEHGAAPSTSLVPRCPVRHARSVGARQNFTWPITAGCESVTTVGVRSDPEAQVVET
jgi:hypothetical protein